MPDKIITINHLEQSLIASKELTARVASSCAGAIEEITENLITMEQVNSAIENAIQSAITATYYGNTV